MAIIELEDMSFYAFHGCFAQEQIIGTHFRVDLLFEFPSSLAEETDSIQDTVNYLSVYQTIKHLFETPSHLLENISRRILDTLMRDFPQMEYCKVKVTKLNPPLGGKLYGVSVTLDKRK
ncbi:MAG: dihydroneopterin aldolase [Bacteroidales bacterium]|jgi:dihydroneopterin aldolase|nr:dihydroneopterin aldolase [Bacteroidales bacterium]MDD4703167.1 dihydroneopterin aldolase [Bacteroidales bacterium]MDX9797750.1 dihydroneopterin aldolase [Bacteroidales bacterium]